MINCNRRDGSARAVNEVAEILAARGHDVHLYARKAEDLDLEQVNIEEVTCQLVIYRYSVGLLQM